MATISKKQALAYRMELTAWFGIAVFALGLIAQIYAFVIMWSDFSRQPLITKGQLPTYFIGWVLPLMAAIIPPAVAFFAGERLAKPRTKYEHMYNGVLFAFLAIWLSATLSALVFTFMPVPLALAVPFEYLEFLPQLGALAIVTVLAFAYGKKYKHIVLHDFKPYQYLLIGCMGVIFAMGAMSFAIGAEGQAIELIAMATLGMLVSFGMIVIPYIFSNETRPLTRLTHACLAGSIGIWSLIGMATMLGSAPKLESLQVIIPSVTGLAAWFVYIYLLHRHKA